MNGHDIGSHNYNHELISSLNNVDLRVLLEPNFPVEELDFFEGPVYVMMCYNLHSGFSEPGEKSNKEFIKELIFKMEDIPGRKDFAIPTGGFEWSSNEEVCQINEKDAEEKIDKFDGERVRDKSSGYLIGRYKDYKDIEHEIWYADKETLKILAEPIVERGYDISIWRLDGK